MAPWGSRNAGHIYFDVTTIEGSFNNCIWCTRMTQRIRDIERDDKRVARLRMTPEERIASADHVLKSALYERMMMVDDGFKTCLEDFEYPTHKALACTKYLAKCLENLGYSGLCRLSPAEQRGLLERAGEGYDRRYYAKRRPDHLSDREAQRALGQT